MMSLGVLAGGMLASCSSDGEPGLSGTNSVKMNAPKIVAYSGNHYWGQDDAATRGGEVTSQFVETTLIDRAYEAEIINEWLPEKNGNLKEGLNADFLFYADKDLSLEFYPVFSQTTTENSLGLFYYDENGGYHEMIVWENMNPWGLTSSEWKWTEEKGSYEVVTSKGVQINVPAGCKFGFFWQGHTNTGTTTYYSVADKNVETICTDGNGNRLPGDPKSKLHAVTFQLEGKTYLGLEDWTDFDFQDWVFTCDYPLQTVPSDDTEVTPEPPTPPTPPTVENCDKCGHPSHGKTCDQCGDDEGCNHTDVPKTVTGDEVEVNLTIEGEGNDVDQSHLSIHVRAATNVDVFIPCPLEYLCPADDMAIVKKHLEDQMAHGGTQVAGTEGVVEGMVTTMMYKIGNFYVDFYVEYVVAGVPSSTGEVFEEDGIHVWTTDIEEELINYLERNYGDGITFELWNYFSEDVTYEMLKPYFDRARVKFVDKEPDAYINAFNKTEGGTQYERDCHVGIDDSQKGNYNDSFKGNHYNGSPFNDIYTNKNAVAEE